MGRPLPNLFSSFLLRPGDSRAPQTWLRVSVDLLFIGTVRSPHAALKLGSHKGNMGLHLPQAPPSLRIIISKPRVWKQFPQEGEAARRVP